MKTFQFEGVVTALSSIHHNGGKKLGVTSLMRREIVVQPDGEREEVAVISGNSLRKKIIRICGMKQMLRTLGYGVDEDDFLKAVNSVEEQDTFDNTNGLGQVEAQLEEDEIRAVRRAGLTLPAFHFLFGGGALTKEGGEALNLDSARYLRRLIPLVGILGGAIAGVILPGKLKCGKAIPLVQETQHILPAKFFPSSPQSIYTYLQREMYTRKDEGKNPHLHRFLDHPALRKLLGDEPKQAKLLAADKETKPAKANPQQMKYYVETIAMGVQLFWEMHLEECTAIEFEAVQIAQAEFEKCPFIGAKSNVGHGKVRIDKGRWLDKSSSVTVDVKTTVEGREITEPITGKYQEHLKNNKSEIKSVLARMK